MWLLQGCYNFLHGSNLNQGSLLNLFLHLCYFTKIHTPISKKVNLQTYLEIGMKFIFCLSNYWRWLSYNEISLLLFYKFFFNQFFNRNQHYKCFFCLFFLFFFPFDFLDLLWYLPIHYLPIHCLLSHNRQILLWCYNMALKIID